MKLVEALPGLVPVLVEVVITDFKFVGAELVSVDEELLAGSAFAFF